MEMTTASQNSRTEGSPGSQHWDRLLMILLPRYTELPVASGLERRALA